MLAVSVSNLFKNYGRIRALSGVSFTVEAGEFAGFIGPNGAGKTTTIKCILGLRNFSGSIKVFGVDNKLDGWKKNVGYVPQEYNLDHFLTLGEMIILNCKYYGFSRKDSEQMAEDSLNEVGLGKYFDRHHYQLSGGEKRRALLARAVSHNPKLLILDEPTANVDADLRVKIHKMLKKKNDEGMTVFLTTHYIGEIEKLAEKVIIIHKGKVLREGKKDDLISILGRQKVVVELSSESEAKTIAEKFDGSSNGRTVLVECRDGEEVLPSIIKSAIEIGSDVKRARVESESLENIFLRLIE